LFCTQKGRGVAENKWGIHTEFPFTAGEVDSNIYIFFSSLYRATEQDIEVIRPTICTRVFFVLKSLQF